MKRLAIVYHSQSGATLALAKAAEHGASLEEDVELQRVPALEADARILLWADGLLFASPENLGYLSGGMKDFFDRTFYTAAGKVPNKPYAVIISAGNDGSNAARQLQRIVSGYPMRPIADPLIIRGEPDDTALSRAEELGQTLAAGLSLGIF